MPGTKIIFDADALIALINEGDVHHQKSLEITQSLVKNEFISVVPYAIILEAATALARNRDIARFDLSKKLLTDYAEFQLPTEFDSNVGTSVADKYEINTSRKNTPFDHYLLALAKKNNIKYIFSFDSFYKKQGLTLAQDLLK